MIERRSLIIPGPCAPVDEEDILIAGEEAKKRGLLIVRVSLWKPRTEPGWDGMHEAGIPGLIKLMKMGLTPATEVLNWQQAKLLIDVAKREVAEPCLALWNGSRQQSHEEQIRIARIAAREDWVILGMKNQPWRNEKHWNGMLRHVKETGGFPTDRLLAIHRGFDPGTDEPRDPNALRNNPDYAMARRVSDNQGVRVALDPSHIGGTVANVFRVVREGWRFSDGLMIEVRDDPKKAKTDQGQHLTWQQLDILLEELGIETTRVLAVT